MLVDTALLRMAADFSLSAGTVAERGASRFASTQLTAGVFGDFDVAHGFHRALCRAHEASVTAMQGHGVRLAALADDASTAAAIFDEQDATSGAALNSAARDLT